MKRLFAGIGLTVLAVPSAHAWSGSVEDMRTMHANENYPLVRVKSHHVTTCCGYQRHVRPHYRQQVHKPQASGWQRHAQVVPQARRKPVHMTAYYQPHPAQYGSVPMHRIVGTAQPMCRYIR